MSILVIGSTGTIGSIVVQQLARRNAKVRALVHKSHVKLPEGVVAVKGDITDADSLRKALAGIDTVFVLNAVVPDELNRALLMFGLIREAGIKRVVYQSMFHADTFLDCGHASAKFAAELMLERFGIPTSILRPNYFFQNDGLPVLSTSVYPMAIGSLGVSMVDARDIAEVAALRLIARDNAPEPLPSETIEIHGPDVITSHSAVAMWSEVLEKGVTYVGDDLAAFEKRMAAMMPSDIAYDTTQMFRGFQRDGMVAPRESAHVASELLGRPMRSYRRYAEEMREQQPTNLVNKLFGVLR